MSPKQTHTVFAEEYAEEAVERMKSVGRVTLLDSCDERTLVGALVDCDALLVRSSARVSRAILQNAPCLRVIGRGGVGLDNIDLPAAKERGVAVVYTPAAGTDAVADLTVGLLIALLRRIPDGDAAVRTGRFKAGREASTSHELAGLTLGIVGMGRIGRAVARRCRHGFGMSILYNDIVRPGLLGFVATGLSKTELYRGADIVSLHVPLTDATRHMIDERALEEFKPGSLLINTARGGIVNTEAVGRALLSGRLSGAAFDVIDPEPPPPKHPLLLAPNTLFTPHSGARTHAALHRMNAVVEDVIRVLDGLPPLYPAWK